MKVWKKMLAVLLALSLAGTAAPASAFAESGTKPEETAEPETGEPEGLVTPQEGENQAAVPARKAARSVVEEYTALTVGQELHQTTGERETYKFSPEQSGYYNLSCDSVGGQEFHFSAEKCIYYTEDEEGNPVQKERTLYLNIMEQKMNRIVWLNQKEEYIFYCQSYQYYETDEYDFKIRVNKADIKDITVAQNPAADSYEFINYAGMQVSINFEDGTNILSEVQSNRYDNSCSVEVFEWQNIAYDRRNQISSYAYLQSVDHVENGNVNVSELSPGSHTAELQLREEICNADGSIESKSYDFQAEFTVNRGNVASIQVQNFRTEYTQDFNETLREFELAASYHDGSEDKVISSSDVEVDQYLEYTETTETGTTTRTTKEIDTYLQNGGSTGEAEVIVTYRGAKTSYPITILENPYERMEMKPRRTTYYEGCSDRIDEYFDIILYKKDGAKKFYYGWYSLPDYWRRGNYGLKAAGQDSYYQDIQDFINAGGTTGTQTLEVSYCGRKASCEVTIKENPYDHIKVHKPPKKLKYLLNKNQSLDFSGMEIYAYKDAQETEFNYDVYSYDDYLSYENDPGNMTEEQYEIMSYLFRSTLGGHNDLRYLELGEHPVEISLLGHSARYQIEVIEQMAESMTILQAPEKLTYYQNSNSNINLYGLIIEVKDLQGNSKKYKYRYYPSEDEKEEWDDGSYGSWRDIENNCFSYSWDIDWSRTGNNTVTLECYGVEDTYEVTIVEDPVKELKITKMPDKTSYYQYERSNIDLTGMEYEVIFQDGTSYSGSANRWNPQFYYGEEWFDMSRRWKSTFNGQLTPGENTIVISAFGEKAELNGIVVKEDPVKSMEVVKNPEKMQYIGNDRRIDLYGMELLITYVDGTSETVVISEHIPEQKLENQYGRSITADLSWTWIDDESKSSLRISYINMKSDILLQDVDLSQLDPVGLADEECYHTILTDEKAFAVYSFTPAETKEYHLFSSSADNIDTYAQLYDESSRFITEDYNSGGTGNFLLSYKLEAGNTYYFLVSHYNLGTASEFDCYFSSSRTSLAGLEVTDFEIIKPAKNIYYDFEPELINPENLSLYGTEYQMTYSNGWTKTDRINHHYGSQMTVDGKLLSVKWKYTVVRKEEWGQEEYVEKRDDNALIYTYGDKVRECPVQFDVPSPIESLAVTAHPWQDKGIYQYQANDLRGAGLSVTIRYNDGRNEETVVWPEYAWNSYDYKGYDMRLNWNQAELLPGQENTLALSYMGKTAEIPVMVLESPVQSMQIKKLPDKTEYYPFEDRIDLYGLKLLITYKDGTEQAVEVTEHGNSVDVPGAYEGKLSVRQSYHEENQEVFQITYLDSVTELMPRQNRKFTLSDSISLNLGEEKQKTMTEGYQIFSFVPPETGIYKFQACAERYFDYMIIYDADGMELARNWGGDSECEMTEGDQYFLAVVSSQMEEQKITCSVTEQSGQETKKIETINLNLAIPEAGNPFGEFQEKYQEYYVMDYQWLNDAEGDGIADYGTQHRVMLALNPNSGYQFTTDTAVMVNGTRLSTKSLASNGKMTLYYTFPYTKCRISVPETEGYEADQSQNAEFGFCNYGENYKFRYLKKSDNTSSDTLIVKTGDTVLKPDEEGYYVIEKVTGNVNVTVKTSGLQAGENESKLTFYNQSADIFDILIGQQNRKIAENENRENSLPVLESYPEGSDQSFYGWYLDKDASINGTGTRFTSQSVLLNPLYDLYAKWGSGYFSYIFNNKQINCKFLSIDEYNRTKVQVGDGSNKTTKAAPVYFAIPGQKPRAAESTLVIPETLDLKNNTDLVKLGVEFAEGEVTAIASNAFSGEAGITNISLPKTIEHIGAGAFEGCTSLEEINIPEGVSAIGAGAFSGCESLQKISIPSSVGVISQGVFQGCTNLNSVNIAEGVSEIEAGAFEGCSGLTMVTLPDTLEKVDAASFAANQNLTIVCSSTMKDSEAVQTVKEATGAKILTVDIKLNCSYHEKQFVYGDKARIFTASVSVDDETAEDREVVWTYPDTTAYEFAVNQENHSITVTPIRATTEEENIVISATDKETGRSKTLSLKTEGIDLGQTSGDGSAAYFIQEIGTQAYTGEEVCPQPVVINNRTKEVLAAENYDVSYSDNIEVGTARIIVRGKGNYKGTLMASFRIERREKQEQILTVSETEITKKEGDAPFEITASTTGDGTISFQSSDPKVATVGNAPEDYGRVTIHGAGTTELTVTVSETEKYYAANQVIRLTVKPNKAAQKQEQTLTVSETEITKKVGDAPFEITASTTGDGAISFRSSNTSAAIVGNTAADFGRVTILGEGTTEITVKAAETEKYYAASKVIRLTVTSHKKKNQEIQASDITKTYGAGSFDVGASSTGDGILTYSSSNRNVAKVNGRTGRVRIMGAGTADIVIRASETQEYQKASKTIKLTVRKADAKLKVSKKSYHKVYGAKAFKLGVSSKAALSYTSSSKKTAVVKNGKVVIKACGTAVITVSVNDKNYNNASQKITIKIRPKKASVKKALSKKAGQITVTWKRQKEAAGYVVQYSTDKSFEKKVKSVEIKKNRVTKTTIKKLSKGKKYYVRVKAYTKNGSKKAYGTVSRVKRVSVK